MCAKILVAGGNGFIGSEICRRAVEAGHTVTSLSRHGRPSHDAPWMDKVEWIETNILAPEEWRDQLQDCDAVIHAVGLDHESPEEGHTYERLYRDSVEILAWEAEHAGVQHFVCISSSVKPPFRSDRYIEAKREGEAFLRGRNFHESILRPAYVYGPDHPASMMLGGMMKTVVEAPVVKERLRGMRPLRVEQVATAALRAATEDGYEGVIDVENIAYLAADRWKDHANGHSNGHDKGQKDHKRLHLDRRVVAAGLLAAAGVVGGVAWALRARRQRPTGLQGLLRRGSDLGHQALRHPRRLLKDALGS